MKDINSKKTAKESKSPEKKTVSRAAEIEEIYRGNGRGNNSDQINESEKDWYRNSVSSNRTSKYDWKFWTGLVVVLLIFILGLFAFTKIFGRVSLVIVPTQGDIFLSGLIPAILSTTTASTTDPALTFSTISGIQDTEKRIVDATGQEKVSTKAQGQIIIYNKYSTAKQSLVTNTRFEAPDGKIYRIQKSVTVPGYTKKGSEIIPGQIEVTVFADKAGVEYNRSNTDFTIPGFVGSPKFQGFFARSKTDISGGFVGTVKKVSTVDLESNHQALQKILRERIIKKARQDLPAKFVLFPDAIQIKFTDVIISDQSQLPAGKTYVALRADLSGLIFDRQELARYLAKQWSPNYDGLPVDITNLDQLQFTLQNKDLLDFSKVEKMFFSLEGKAHLVWLFDLDKLKARLAGVSSSEMHKILASEFPAINTVTPSFFPPWLWTFPSNSAKINLSINNDSKRP